MKIEFRPPELGDDIASGEIVRVLVREGDVDHAIDYLQSPAKLLPLK
jgi:hypothetical protein